jgi:hypothetical protein
LSGTDTGDLLAVAQSEMLRLGNFQERFIEVNKRRQKHLPLHDNF